VVHDRLVTAGNRLNLLEEELEVFHIITENSSGKTTSGNNYVLDFQYDSVAYELGILNFYQLIA
jgi:hypothetical protein